MTISFSYTDLQKTHIHVIHLVPETFNIIFEITKKMGLEIMPE